VVQVARVFGRCLRRSCVVRSIFASSILILAAGPALSAPALPTGGQVGAGSASIGAMSGDSLTVSQASDRAIIDWQGFSIGEGGSVRFENGAGATLNRVTGSAVSAIDGLLTASGSVYLINPNGVIVGRTGEVQVGGTFAASTLDLSDSAFLAGGELTFSGTSPAAVINYGHIGSLGGDVALIATRVENHGRVEAANGDVGLAAGYRVVLRDATLDDGRFQVLAGGADTSATNDGTIAAAEAELRANGGNVYALAGNTGSLIQATGVAADDGRVFLVAEGGSTTAQGRIEATGQVETSGASVDFTGLRVAAPNWLVDPYDLTIDAAAATTISTNLAATSVVLKTTAIGATGPGVQNPSGVGDINVTAPISWASANTLTLDAYHSISITAPITASGAGKVVLTTNDGGAGGDYGFGLGSSGFVGRVAFTGSPNAGQGLTINNQAYVLLYSMADVVAINSDRAGVYALARTVNATGTIYTASVVTSAFTGSFTGLGNTISNLTINAPSASNVGLFAQVDQSFSSQTGATVRDVGIVGGSITGHSFVGALVGAFGSNGTSSVFNVYATAAVGGGASSLDLGGLVGLLSKGSIVNAYATGAVTGGANSNNLGGLVGGAGSGASITNVYATGAASGASASSNIGGLVGALASGAVTGAHATGAVSDVGGGGNTGVGGLIGSVASGASVINAYATGAVTGNGASEVGGLVGVSAGSLNTVYATGNVASGTGSVDVGGLVGAESGGSVVNAYATGAVTGDSKVGGLMGEADGGTSLSIAYATGNVSGTQDVGGLIGWSFTTLNLTHATGSVLGSSGSLDLGGLLGLGGGTISNSYATGSVTGPGASANIGGFVGEQTGAISSSYATGAVSGGVNSHNLGGLVGFGGSSITNSYATGAVTSAGGASAGNLSLYIGGLVGSDSGANAIQGSYATGSVTTGQFSSNVGGLLGFLSTGSISNDFATGAVTAGSGSSTVGGLLGGDFGGTSITNVYATGNVAAGSGSAGIGGLVGLSEGDIVDAYSIGSVSAGSGSTAVGALVGQDKNNSAMTAAYYNTDTAGQALGVGEIGLGAGGAFGSVGFTTSQLQGVLPSGFGPSFWGTATGIYPYLKTFFPNGVQLVRGAARDSNGVATANALLAVYTGGALLAGGPQTSAADGSFYALAPTGTITSATRVAATLTLVASQGVSGYTYTDQPTLSSGNLLNFDVTSHAIAETTGAPSFTAMGADLTATLSPTAFAVPPVDLVNPKQSIRATNATGFTVDLNLGFSGLTIDATQGIDVTARLLILGAGQVALTINDGGAGGALTFGLSASGFSGNLAFSGTPHSGQSLSINGQDYTLVYSMADLVGMGNGHYALATSLNPIGPPISSPAVAGTFNGTLNGLGNPITNLSISASSTTGVGLFGVIGSGGLVSNLGLYSVSVSGASNVGLLAGQNDGTISSSFTSGTVNGGASAGFAGGLVGYNTGHLSGDISTAAVTGNAWVGGLAGANFGTIDGLSRASGKVSGQIGAGGLVGENGGILNGVGATTGAVSAPTFAGGLVGVNEDVGVIILASTSGATVTSSYAGGGLVGLNSGSVTGSTSSDAVSATEKAGGLVGMNLGTLSGDGASGQVSGPNQTGGLVGFNAGSVSASSASGAVSGGASSGYVGGLVGYNVAHLSGVSATGVVSGSAWIGGLAGYNSALIDGASSASGAVNGQVGIGGLVGDNVGALSNVSAGSGTVSATSFAGGLVGYNEGAGTIAGAHATGAGVGSPYAAGGLVGLNVGSVTGSTSSDTVGAAEKSGGLVGMNIGTLSGDSASGQVSGPNQTGGLVGFNAGSVSASSASGTVSGGVSGGYIGGLVGYNLAHLSGVSATGAVSGLAWIGGLAGYNSAVIDGTASASGQVSGQVGIGGLVGDNAGTLSNVSAGAGAVSGSSFAGGLVGYNESAGAITAANASGTVTAAYGGGGLVGLNSGSVSQSFATGQVNASEKGGGLIGLNLGSIADSYTAGPVLAGTQVGGLVGFNAGSIQTSWTKSAVAAGASSGGVVGLAFSGSITNVYWDVTLTGQPAAAGPGSGGTFTNVTVIGGATGYDAHAQATYAGFDFTNVWAINPGASRPYLKNVATSTPVP